MRNINCSESSAPEQLELDLRVREPRKQNSPIDHPEHYTQGTVECIEALASATINLSGRDAVCTANAIKYLWRWKQKGGIEDLRKARWYIDHLIESYL